MIHSLHWNYFYFKSQEYIYEDLKPKCVRNHENNHEIEDSKMYIKSAFHYFKLFLLV